MVALTTLLRGRGGECARLDRLLEGARAGRSAALVLRGEPGIGKTALLQYVAERADDLRLLKAAGVESEMELPFAGLRQLCEPLMGRLEELPRPQWQALGTAFGLTSFRRPDRFLIALSVLSLLSDAAEEGPIVCLVDDAHWLDQSSAQVLAFVARRLQEESVLLLFAERETLESDALAGLPDLLVAALSDAVARELLASVITGPLDAQVREQILVEARGNPLALLELPNERSPTDLAGGFGLPAEPPVRDRIEASFRRRVRDLPVETQQLLLVAAADPTGDSALLWRALARLGVPPESAVPAETEGLLEFGARILFRHPLLRSAVYGAASDEERRVAHGALAAATDVELDPDRRAWHRAWATLVVDEDVAAELERSAVRAHARGGLPAAAAFLERAAAITPEIGTRTRRVLAAAEAKLLAGAPQTALGLLATVAVGPLVERDRATLQRYRGQIALDLRHGADATDLLLDAARRLEPFDPDLARDTYVDALRAASISGRLGDRTLEAAEAARNAPAPTGAPRAIDLLLDSLALRFTEGYVPSVPGLKEALRAVLDEETRGVEDVRWPWSGRRVAPDLFDDDTWRTLALLNVQRARDQGALAVLPLALHYLAQFRVFEGNFDSATALVDEADGVADAIGSERIEIGSVLLAGCRGDEARGLQALEDSQRRAAVRGEGVLLTFGEHARAVLFNGLGRYNEALTPAVSAYTRDELCASTWSIAEAVEAAARCGREGVAAEALGRLAERTRAVGSEWALGVEARSRAIVEDGARADELYCEAIYRLGSCRMAFDRARAHLLYGEWLRRKRRRVDAREQLRTAHDLFTQMGAQAFAGRAARELRATGEKMQRREAHTRDQLTAQEVQIAWLARDGLSNPEIAAQLFISPRTVEYHLHKVFGKLAIGRRSQLVRVLGEAR